MATSIFGVLESVQIRPNPTPYRIRPNPEPISVGSKCPYRLYHTAEKSPAGLLGIRPNPSESDPPPNPSESGTAIPDKQAPGFRPEPRSFPWQLHLSTFSWYSGIKWFHQGHFRNKTTDTSNKGYQSCDSYHGLSGWQLS